MIIIHMVAGKRNYAPPFGFTVPALAQEFLGGARASDLPRHGGSDELVHRNPVTRRQLRKAVLL